MPIDLSPLTGPGGAPDTERTPALEYGAVVTSPLISGEVTLAVGEEALSIAALFNAADVPYAGITALELKDYAVTARTLGGDFLFSRMGSWCEPFYDALCDAYNKKVLRALFVEGDPVLTARGEYRYTEGGRTFGGLAPVRVYADCVCVLPPDLGARRVPLCFLSGMDKGGYELTLSLGGGDSCTLRKLGYDTAPLADSVEKQLRKLREKAVAAVRKLDGSLSAAQASRIASLMPEGVAAPLSQLGAISPSFAATLGSEIRKTRAAESFTAFLELCDPARIYVGMRKNAVAGDGAEPVGGEGAEIPDPYLFWMIAPSPGGSLAAVEFSEADSATFIYRTNGDFDGFARRLNQALEAIAFKREVIRLTDAELSRPEYAGYRMAVQRNGALRLVRSGFEGRIIHSGAWKRRLLELWAGK